MGQYQQKTPEFLIKYVKRISTILQDDFIAAKLYGSFARGEQTDDSDIDIVIFTKKTQDQYISLMKKIVDVTMEYNDKYNVWISPVFQNYELFKQREKIVPYYQNIQKEGIRIG